MYKLNADCHLHILSFLTLTEQLVLKRVSTSLFTANVHYYWRLCKKFTLSQQLHEFHDVLELSEFLDVISPHVQILHLQGISTRQLRGVWRPYRFAKLQQLICCVLDDDMRPTDEHVLLLTQIFPAVKQLTLTSHTSGEYLCHFRSLIELKLHNCFGLQSDCFVYIFNLLHLSKFSLLYERCYRNIDRRLQAIADCKTLKSVEINAELAVDSVFLMESLTDLPNLRTLTFKANFFYDILLTELVSRRAKYITGLIYNGIKYAYDDKSTFQMNLRKVKMLRRLILHCIDNEDLTLLLIAKHCRNLEVLHVTYNTGIIIRNELLKIFELLTNLQILDVTGTPICEYFVQDNVISLESALSKRTVPLKLHCSETCDGKQLKQTIRHEMLQVIFTPHRIELPSYGFMTVELLPKCK